MIFVPRRGVFKSSGSDVGKVEGGGGGGGGCRNRKFDSKQRGYAYPQL